MKIKLLLLLAAMSLLLSSCGCHNRYGSFHRPSGWAMNQEQPTNTVNIDIVSTNV